MTSTGSLPVMSDHNVVLSEIDISPKFTTSPPGKIQEYNQANWSDVKEAANDIRVNYFAKNPDKYLVQENCKFIEKSILDNMDSKIPSKF